MSLTPNFEQRRSNRVIDLLRGERDHLKSEVERLQAENKELREALLCCIKVLKSMGVQDDLGIESLLKSLTE